ncbi:hypothetical protein M885DRAFT_466676, partial [Pelagophyceae sp. CCMP2097]
MALPARAPLTKKAADAAATRMQALARRALARQAVYVMIAARWERIYDPLHGRFYYYHLREDRASWKRPTPLMWRDLETTAPTFTPPQASLLIQSAWRRTVDVRKARKVLVTVVSKVLEEGSAGYYYNSRTGSTSWAKPKMLGSHDILDGKLVDADGTVVIDDGEDSVAPSEATADDAASEGESDDSSAPPPREWPRSVAQRLVDVAEDECAESLCLSHLDLLRLSFRVLNLECLTHLDVSHNRIAAVPADLGSLTNLTRLDYSNNVITKLPLELQDLVLLRTFILRHNRLRQLPPRLYRLAALEDWDVAFNELVDLPVLSGDVDLLRETRVWDVGLGLLAKLVRFDASSNRLQRWPPQLDQLEHLEELRLSDNAIDVVGPPPNGTAAAAYGWAKLAKLRVLEIARNRLVGLPAGFGEMLALEHVDVQDNKIESLPASLEGLKHVQRFLLKGNALRELPEAVSALRGLLQLDCCRNHIRSTAPGLSQLRLVKEVHLDGNDLHELGTELAQLRACAVLSLRNNQLEALPRSFGAMFKLQRLYLSHNRFRTVDGDVLASLVSLVELDLSHNSISGALPAKLFRLAKLRSLDLSNNQIDSIPGDVRGLIGLVELHLDSNLLESIPGREFAMLSKLEVLTLDHNLLKGRALDGLAAAPKLKVLRFDHNPISRCAEAALDKLGALRSRASHLRVVADTAQDDDYDAEMHSDRYRLHVQLSRARLRQARGSSAGTESLERGEFEEALKSLKIAVDAAPTDSLAHFAEGLAHVGCARHLAPAHGDALEMDEAELHLIRHKKKELHLARTSLTTAALHLELQNSDVDFSIRPELFYARAMAAHALGDSAGAIHDIKVVLGRRSEHVPTLLLRADARCALGQFPQARRDCTKARRLLGEQAKAAHSEDAEGKLEAAETQCLIGLETLSTLRVLDPNLQRIFEATPDGLLNRRSTDLSALEREGRSAKRFQRERAAAEKANLVAQQAAIDDAFFVVQKRYAKKSDRIKADIAARAAVWQLERDADALAAKVEREAVERAERQLLRGAAPHVVFEKESATGIPKTAAPRLVFLDCGPSIGTARPVPSTGSTGPLDWVSSTGSLCRGCLLPGPLPRGPLGRASGLFSVDATPRA